MKFNATQIAEALHRLTALVPRMDGSQPLPWDQLTEEQRQSSIQVVHDLMCSDVIYTAEQLHDVWQKKAHELGWTYGPVYDLDRKEHPSMLPFDRLPDSEVFKDQVWHYMIRLFKPYYGGLE